ncbi:carbamoyltransferase N-terminal domain-containing protein [Pseudonocardia sp. TMWB2A]|uniref:carbamoyltransferase N-terminal domain-containing protein n=1 Tax=Pseudonocardia sp. TMWB2A TaxID=687430 RepID=UPI00307F0603
MLICGIKVTHDGGVALVEDGHLVFSAEMEKLANRERHARIEDLSVVFDLLRSHGYDPADLDHLVIDGWRKTDKIKMWGGQEISLPLAPYRRGILHTDLLKPYTFTSLDLTYESYPHYAGHVASAYCSSEFAREGADAYILCWDGAMFPFVYHYSPDARRLRAVGPPFYMLGDVYHTLAQGYPPFDDDVAWPHTLALPGKIMAYVSLGTPDKTAVQALHTVYQQAVATVLGTGDVPDDAAHELAGRRILERMRDRLSAPGASAEDMLASIHRFLTDIVVDGLVKVIDADGRRTPNLCLVGGCALNIKWNRAIRDSGIADTVWVPPFPNDAGSAIGAACCALLTHTTTPYLDWSVYSGPSLPTTETTPPGWTASPCTITELAHVLHHTGPTRRLPARKR